MMDKIYKYSSTVMSVKHLMQVKSLDASGFLRKISQYKQIGYFWKQAKKSMSVCTLIFELRHQTHTHPPPMLSELAKKVYIGDTPSPSQ